MLHAIVANSLRLFYIFCHWTLKFGKELHHGIWLPVRFAIAIRRSPRQLSNNLYLFFRFARCLASPAHASCRHLPVSEESELRSKSQRATTADQSANRKGKARFLPTWIAVLALPILVLDRPFQSVSQRYICTKMTLSRLFQALALVVSTSEAFIGSSRSSRSSFALSSKNSDRAHIERNLEDMMDNDWRLFRAKLVAQEKAQNTANVKESPTVSASSETSAELPKPLPLGVDEKLTKQGQLSEIFAGAISSIFKKDKNVTTNARAVPSSRTSSNEDIFHGDHVGGADFSQISSDPFVSADELPLWIDTSRTPKVDKHRWAHEISHVEPGCVLIANEKLGGVFHQTVVLIIDHHETTGSTGIVINRYVNPGVSPKAVRRTVCLLSLFL